MGLPNELLLQIAQSLVSWRDLSHLAAGSRHLNGIVSAHIARQLTHLDLDAAWLAWLIEEHDVRGVKKALCLGISPNKAVDFELLQGHFESMVLFESSNSPGTLLMYRRAAGGDMVGLPQPDDSFWHDEHPEATDVIGIGMTRPRRLFEYARRYRSKDFSLLHLAAQRGNTEVIQILLDHGANIEAFYLDKQGGLNRAGKTLVTYNEGGNHNHETHRICPYVRYTPLHCAILSFGTRAAKLLLEAGASTKCCTTVGKITDTDWMIPASAFHAAAFLGNQDLLEHMMSGTNPFDVNEKDEFGSTPLVYATIGSQIHTVGRYLLQHGANPNILVSPDCSLLLDACWHRRFDDVLLLLEFLIEPEHKDITEALHVSCALLKARRRIVCSSSVLSDHRGSQEQSRLTVVRKLLELGISSNGPVNHPWLDGDTPMCLAVNSGLLDITKELIAHGAVLDLQSGCVLFTALNATCDEQSMFDTVCFLLDQDCNVNLMDDLGNTPLQTLAMPDSLGRHKFNSSREEIIGCKMLALGAGIRAYRPQGTEQISVFQDFCRPGSYRFCKVLADRGAADLLGEHDIFVVFEHLVRNFSTAQDKTEQVDLLNLLLSVDQTNSILRNPKCFEVALQCQEIKTAQHLLEFHCALNAEHGNSGKILYRACFIGAVEVVELLLDRDIDVDGLGSCHSWNNTLLPIQVALNYAVQQPEGTACEERGFRLLKLLLARGADIHQVHIRHDLLYFAICRNRIDLVEMILQASTESIPAFPNALLLDACSSIRRICKPEVIWALLNCPDYQGGLVTVIEGPSHDDSRSREWKTPLEWMISTYRPLEYCPREDCDCGHHLLKCIVVLLSKGELTPQQAQSPQAKQLLNASRETLLGAFKDIGSRMDSRIDGTGLGGRGKSTRHCLEFIMSQLDLTSAEMGHFAAQSSFLSTVL